MHGLLFVQIGRVLLLVKSSRLVCLQKLVCLLLLTILLICNLLKQITVWLYLLWCGKATRIGNFRDGVICAVSQSCPCPLHVRPIQTAMQWLVQLFGGIEKWESILGNSLNFFLLLDRVNYSALPLLVHVVAYTNGVLIRIVHINAIF